jgi:hypothetical protein
MRRGKTRTLGDNMTGVPLPRVKSGLLTAAGFAVLVALLVVIGMSLPALSALVYGALYFTSPFTWGWGLFAGMDAPWPVEHKYLPLLFAAPFPLVGLIVGCLWPLPIASGRIIGMRVAVSFLILSAIGPLLFALALSR